MIMMPYGRCRSSLQLTGTQTSGTPQAAWVRSHWEIENCLHQAGKTLRRSMSSRPRCGYGRGGCWAWRQRLSC